MSGLNYTGEEDDSKCELVGDTSEIINAIARFHDNEELSDVVLKLGSQRFYAHKFVLLLMSDVFKTMCSKRWENSHITEIELNECEQCIPVFPAFLHFLYHGQVKVTTTTALPLLMLADKYNVQPLKISCEVYIQKQVEGGNVVGAIRWLPYLQLCEHNELEDSCIEVIIIEMEYIIGCDDFLLLNFDLLVRLLERSDLVVPCEYVLYTAVVKWIESKENEDVQKYVDALMPLIRFSMMFPENLLQVERSPFYQKYNSKICPYIALAHRYRSLIPDVVDEAFSAVLYHPRNYTHQLWCHFFSLDADNSSFFNKSYNVPLAYHPLPTATKPQEPTWQFQVQKCEKRENSSMGSSRSMEERLWNTQPGVGFASSSNSNSFNLPLQLAVRPLKALSSNVAVDISLFCLKKDSISKQLDTAAYIPIGGQSDKTPPKSKTSKSQFSFQAQDKMFQPSPMHFSFSSVPAVKDRDIVLRHHFLRNELDSPPEVPCVQFGPGFGHTVRPIHTIKLALIVKPRFKSSTELAAASGDSENFLPNGILPLLG